MEIINMLLTDLVPYEKNPRRNDEAVKYVAESIRQFGFKVPIIIDKDGVIVAGHTRYKAAKNLKMEEVPCIVADDLSDEQIKAFRLADNKVAEKAEWDFNVLADELESIVGIDMEALGFVDDSVLDEYGTDFSLPDGDKPEIVTMTFTLHEQQKQLIDYALQTVSEQITETFGNTNKNGNALHEVVRQWAEQRK